MKVITAYDIGFDLGSQLTNECMRQISLELERNAVAEQLEGLESIAIPNILETLSNKQSLTEEQKEQISNTFHSFIGNATKLSYITAKKYEMGKNMQVSTTAIKSLPELPGVLQGKSPLQMMKREIDPTPAIDMLANSLANMVVSESMELDQAAAQALPNGGGKMKSLPSVGVSKQLSTTLGASAMISESMELNQATAQALPL